MKLAELIEENLEEIAALEALNCGELPLIIHRESFIAFVPSPFACFALLTDFIGMAGKPFHAAKQEISLGAIATLKYFAGWADKIQGKTIEVLYLQSIDLTS
jgi:acyl-CoA reductase-like NAD-dependent aldehyde dehydrogenase